MSFPGYPSIASQETVGASATSFPNIGILPTSFQRFLGEPNVGILERGYYSRGYFNDSAGYAHPYYSLGSNYQRHRPLPQQARVTGDGKLDVNALMPAGSVSPPGMSNADAYEAGYNWIGGTIRACNQSDTEQTRMYYRHIGWSGPGGDAIPDELHQWPSVWRADWNYYVSRLEFFGTVGRNGGFIAGTGGPTGVIKDRVSGSLLIPAETSEGDFIYCGGNASNYIASCSHARFSGRDCDGEKCGPYYARKSFTLLKPVVNPDILGTVEVSDTSCQKDCSEDAEPSMISQTTRVTSHSFGPARGWLFEQSNEKIGAPNLSILFA